MPVSPFTINADEDSVGEHIGQGGACGDNRVDNMDSEMHDLEYDRPLPRTMHSPSQPTPAERAQHNITHMPYRSWCHICVRARGDAHPHNSTIPVDVDIVPCVSLD